MKNFLQIWLFLLICFSTSAVFAEQGTGAGDDAAGLPAAGLYGFDGATWDRINFVTRVDGVGTVAKTDTTAYGYIFNGTSWDRMRSVGVLDGASTGLLGVGLYGFGSGAAWDRMCTIAAIGDNISSCIFATGETIFDGTNWDRRRSGVNTGQALVDNSSNGLSNISTNTTTAAKATAGVVNGVIVNTAGTASTVAFYNVASASCTGTPVSGYSFTLTTVSAAFISNINHTFTNGICVVTAGTAAADISVLYR